MITVLVFSVACQTVHFRNVNILSLIAIELLTTNTAQSNYNSVHHTLTHNTTVNELGHRASQTKVT